MLFLDLNVHLTSLKETSEEESIPKNKREKTKTEAEDKSKFKKVKGEDRKKKDEDKKEGEKTSDEEKDAIKDGGKIKEEDEEKSKDAERKKQEKLQKLAEKKYDCIPLNQCLLVHLLSHENEVYLYWKEFAIRYLYKVDLMEVMLLKFSEIMTLFNKK